MSISRVIKRKEPDDKFVAKKAAKIAKSIIQDHNTTLKRTLELYTGSCTSGRTGNASKHQHSRPEKNASLCSSSTENDVTQMRTNPHHRNQNWEHGRGVSLAEQQRKRSGPPNIRASPKYTSRARSKRCEKPRKKKTDKEAPK